MKETHSEIGRIYHFSNGFLYKLFCRFNTISTTTVIEFLKQMEQSNIKMVMNYLFKKSPEPF